MGIVLELKHIYTFAGISTVERQVLGTGVMTQPLKVLLLMTGSLSLAPGTHVMKAENRLIKRRL